MNLKTVLRAIPVILVSVALSTTAVSVKAADPAPSPAASPSLGKKRNVSPETVAKARLTRLKNQVSLTPDQETKAKPIIDKYVADRGAAKGDRTKLKSLKTQYDSDIEAILTPAQRTKLSTEKAANLARLKAGRATRAAEKAAASPAATPATSN